MHVVLIHPDIPGNTGNVGRTCVANSLPLHLVKPMGFSLEDKYLKRSGLDYWPHLQLTLHESISEFEKIFPDTSEYILFSRFGKKSLWDAKFTESSVLMFGSETKGLPQEFMQKYNDQIFSIPMTGPVRSLNLSTAAGVCVYEALRQVRKP